VLEGLAASGLRAIRYAKEVPGIARVDANDLDPAVVDAMRRNVEHNGPEASSRVRPLQGDCRLVMMQVLSFARPTAGLPSSNPRCLDIRGCLQSMDPRTQLLSESAAAAACRRCLRMAGLISRLHCCTLTAFLSNHAESGRVRCSGP